MLQYLDKLQKEDMENLVKKREIQRALMKDVAKANEVSFLNASQIPIVGNIIVWSPVLVQVYQI